MSYTDIMTAVETDEAESDTIIDVEDDSSGLVWGR